MNKGCTSDLLTKPVDDVIRLISKKIHARAKNVDRYQVINIEFEPRLYGCLVGGGPVLDNV